MLVIPTVETLYGSWLNLSNFNNGHLKLSVFLKLNMRTGNFFFVLIKIVVTI